MSLYFIYDACNSPKLACACEGDRGPIFLVCFMTHTATLPKNPAHTMILIIPAVESKQLCVIKYPLLKKYYIFAYQDGILNSIG